MKVILKANAMVIAVSFMLFLSCSVSAQNQTVKKIKKERINSPQNWSYLNLPRDPY